MQQAITQGGPQKLSTEGTNEQSRQKEPWGLVLTTDMFRLEKRSLSRDQMSKAALGRHEGCSNFVKMAVTIRITN